MLEKNIKFICERELVVQFSSLVINVESIEKFYPDGFKGFFLGDIGMSYTNGFIVVVVEMQSYPARLYEIIDHKLQPLGFQEGRDYLIGLDEPKSDIKSIPIPDHELPWCEKANWLGSIVSPKKGNLVWHKFFDNAQEAFCGAIRGEYPQTQFWTFWFDMHPTLKEYRLKKLDKGYPLFRLDKCRYDVVNKEMYGTLEANRMPFLIGSQFGVHPPLDDAFNPEYIGYVAVLNKSLLSGCVAGLTVYVVEENKFTDKLLIIKNINSCHVCI